MLLYEPIHSKTIEQPWNHRNQKHYKRPTVIIPYDNSQIMTVFFNLICQNKFLLCYCEAYLNECYPEMLRNFLVISHKQTAKQTKSWVKQNNYWLRSILRRQMNIQEIINEKVIFLEISIPSTDYYEENYSQRAVQKCLIGKFVLKIS